MLLVLTFTQFIGILISTTYVNYILGDFPLVMPTEGDDNVWESFVMEIWASFLFYTITLHVTNPATQYSNDRMVKNVLISLAYTATITWA